MTIYKFDKLLYLLRDRAENLDLLDVLPGTSREVVPIRL